MSEGLTIVGDGHDPVSGLLQTAAAPQAFLVLAHGAGAPMTHPFMANLAHDLAEHGVSTLRCNFAYTEAGRKRPDRPPRLLSVLRSALELGAQRAEDLPLFAGGKSMGGRMTSTLLSGHGSPGTETEPAIVEAVRGVVFFGFPLHRPGSPSVERAAHLYDVPHPMLFLQGPRDTLADLDHLRPELEAIGSRAQLHVVEGADHGFHVLKRSGRSPEEVREELAGTASRWMRRVAAGNP